MENLQDMLLEHVVPDQVGQVGKIHYSFTDGKKCRLIIHQKSSLILALSHQPIRRLGLIVGPVLKFMKIVQVHWPKVSNSGGLFIANDGALRLQGKYQIQRPGVLGYNKSGEFIFDLGAICLSIKDNSSESQPSPSRSRHHQHHHHQHHHHRHRPQPHDVTCTVGHIKVRFHGGAARVCQFLTSVYIKVYRRHLEAQIAKVIQETVQDDGQILLSALTVMASIQSDDPPGRTGETNNTHSQALITTSQRPASATSSSEPEVGKMQRFLDSFTRHSPQT